VLKMIDEGVLVAAELAMTTELLGKSRDELRAFCAGLGEAGVSTERRLSCAVSERKFDVTQIRIFRRRCGSGLLRKRGSLAGGKAKICVSDGSVRYCSDWGMRKKSQNI